MNQSLKEISLKSEPPYPDVPASHINVRGFFRVAIEENGEFVGDSGWTPNTVTNDGFNDYLVKSLGEATLTGTHVTHVNVGTGTAAILATASALVGEVAGSAAKVRTAVTAASSSSSKTVRFTATLASTNSFISSTSGEAIANVGLFAHSTTNNLFAGNTYSSSQCASNQNVNVTYDIIFS